jgi:two-component system chemotaxis response regulator CheB
MPPQFPALLAKRLTNIGVMPIAEPTDGQEALPGHAYIAPGGMHMAVARSGSKVTLSLNDAPPENSCRPAVDVLFRSAAQVYGGGLLALVLTGMGSDGLKGATAIAQAGGQILAQDEESSVVWGMPGAVVGAGLANQVLPLNKFPDEILFRLQKK